MLIAIYENTESALDYVIEKMEAGESCDLERSRALISIGLIESGLDLSQGDFPQRVRDICLYAENSLLNPNLEAVKSARLAIGNLADGYREIQDEATSLEESGSIPRLNVRSAVDAVG